MKTKADFHKKFLLVLLLPLIFPALCRGAVMNDYCVVPPFIGENVPANLLLMLDNSSSMYDLTYSDQGNTDTNGNITRQPYYCYDETFQSNNTYIGYFNNGSNYQFDFTNKYFTTIASIPASGSCPSNSCAVIPNQLCVGTDASNKVNYFAASGNYLNWLTSSKFDVEKRILTGGKVVSNLCSGTDQACNSGTDCSSGTCNAVATPFLQPESRGCVGQWFIKTALSSDFVNFTATDNNARLGITFAIRGPVDSANPSNPSRGGQTYIDIYSGVYNNGLCQTAINYWNDTSVNQNTLSDAINACINYNPNAQNPNYCSANHTMTGCTTNNDCYASAGGCSNNSSTTCYADSTCGYSTVPGTCSNTQNNGSSISCTSNAGCAIGAVAQGRCSKNTSKTCFSDSDCSGASNYCNSPLPNPSTSGSCNNPAPTTTQNTCSNPSPGFYFGPCVNPTHSGVVKTKIAFGETVQTCWTYLDRGQAIGTGDYNRLIGGGKCDDVYAGFGVCSGNTSLSCSADSDCSANSAGTCTFGPSAITPGNAALICGNDYLGKYCTWNATDKTCSWNTSNPTAIETDYANFCKAQQPSVIDQTDSAASSTNFEQLPALLGGMGLEGQLGSEIGSIPARVQVTSASCSADSDCATGYTCVGSVCKPTGLIQQFGSQIRIGTMNFNFNGSATEASSTVGAAIQMPRVCSNNTTRLCTLDADCSPGYCMTTTNSAPYNLDGGKISYPIGLGFCAAMTQQNCSSDANCSGGNSCINGFCGTMNATECATDSNCTLSGGTCISNGVGNHTTGLVYSIDSVRANAWTPFAEAFYNAIGYFARTSSGASRTDLRLNSGDFSANLNPSQFICQQNNILLITDGSSTADRNGYVAQLATAYQSSALPASYNNVSPTNWDNTCPTEMGSSYLPIMTWIAKNRSISSLVAPASTTSTPTAITTQPANGRDSITTFIVSTGGSNGATGECNSTQMLTDAAINGGNPLYQANNPGALNTALTSIFQQLAAKSASGTAASILSNSAGSGANILQAIFFPRKIFGNQTQAFWLGEINNLWYYVDPFIANSSMREDTNTNNLLELKNDYAVTFGFDNVAGETFAYLMQDTNGDGSGDVPAPCVGSDPRCYHVNGDTRTFVSPDNLKSLWKAGKQLYSRDLSLSPRTIYTPCLTAGTCVSGTGLMKFNFGTYPPSGTTGSVTTTPDNAASLQSYLQASDVPAARKLMKYMHGFDYPGDTGMRNRTVQIDGLPSANLTDAAYTSNPRDKGIGVWKLGDIVSSTPRTESSVRLNAYNLSPAAGYDDSSYGNDSAQTGYIYTSAYQGRGMAYAGANDGMLHAFNLGTLNVTPSGFTKATLSGSGLGNEAWAFMPTNVLPYLKYYADPGYSHLYFMDGNTTVVDASVGTCTGGLDYWLCPKDFTTGTGSNWRTILVGGMGIGGASRDYDDPGNCTTGTGGTCVRTPVAGVGYSSYYALDVTDPNNPKFLWEFSDAAISDANDKGIGFATSGAAIVKISARSAGVPDKNKNGRWFAVFGSGPTGPINANHQFMGTSYQPLKVYVVDLNATPPFSKGTNYWVISQALDGGTSTGATVSGASSGAISNAFAGSMNNGAIDMDRWNINAAGNYQDDAVYFGYTQRDSSTGTWTKGGVLKLLTQEDPDPANWKLVRVLDGTGPVTTGIARLQDRKSHNLWLYFGTGRYFYLKDDFVTNPVERLYGVKEPCYSNLDKLDGTCAQRRSMSDLADQTNADQTVDKGWYISLDGVTTDANNDTLGGERVITDPSALANGAVFFTTYEPNNDFCQFGGASYMWAVKYDTGTQAPASALMGKALVQVSTGEFKQIDLSSAFSDKFNRRMGTAMTGKPPADAPPIISKSKNKPVKRILHMQEH